MAVIFAIVGGGAVLGIATADPYSDYSDYSDYDNYSDYSDAAERRIKRKLAKKEELDKCGNEVNQYKINHVNKYLGSRALKQTYGINVNVSEVKRDGDQQLDYKEKCSMVNETEKDMREVEEIERAISVLNSILDEKEE